MRILTCFVISLWAFTSVALAQSFYVAAIIDGERLVLSDGSRVKLIGVDAIEKFEESKVNQDMVRMGLDGESVRSKGGISAAYVSILVRDRAVKVSYQVEDVQSLSSESKQYNPALVSVLNNEGQMEFLLNKRIIRDGYAFVDPQTPVSFKPQLIELQERAKQEALGFWAIDKNPEIPTAFEQASPSENADPFSRCRSIKGCIWVSSGNPEVGYWKSAAGYTCPCGE